MKKLWLLLAVPVIALDQWVKWWVSQTSAANYIAEFEPSFLGIRLTYVRNYGASLGSFENARWFLVAVSTLAVAAILLAVIKKWIDHTFGVVGLALVLGGAAGNLIDRVRLGYVIDMFDMHFFVNNVADIFVSIGGVMFCAYLLFVYRKGEKAVAGVDENG